MMSKCKKKSEELNGFKGWPPCDSVRTGPNSAGYHKLGRRDGRDALGKYVVYSEGINLGLRKLEV
jgi:hypothetical protein